MNKELLNHFDSLSTGEQDILLALSVIYVPIGQARLQQLLKQSQCIAPAVSNIVARPLREKLEGLGLIELSNEGWRCPDSISEILIKRASQKKDFFEKFSSFLLQHNIPHSHSHSNEGHHMLAELRLHLYQHNEQAFFNQFQKINQTFYSNFIVNTLNQLFFNDFDEAWFNQLPLLIRLYAAQYHQILYRFEFGECELQYRLMNECFKQAKTLSPEFIQQYVLLHLLRGDTEGIEALLTGSESADDIELMGMLCFMQNRNNEALVYFNDALNRLKKQTRKRNICLEEFPGHFFSLALLKSQTQQNLEALRKQLKTSIKTQHWNDSFYSADKRLLIALDVYQAKTKATHVNNLDLFSRATTPHPYERLFQALLLYWLGETDHLLKTDPNYLKNLKLPCQQAHQNGYIWYAAVCSNLLLRLKPKDSTIKKIADQYQDSVFNHIIDLLPRVESWERALDALSKLGDPETAKSTSETNANSSRLIWTLTLDEYEAFLSPKEQRLGKNGRWTKGRAIAIKRLHTETDEFNFLTEHDIKICNQIKLKYEDTYYSYHPKEVYVLDEDAIIAAIGHPHIYWDDATSYDTPINISTGEIQLLVSEKRNKFLLSLSPTPTADSDYLFAKNTDGLSIYKVSPQILKVAKILGADGLLVPKEAKQRVIDSISSIASMLTIQSDIGGHTSLAEEIEPDSRLHIHLQPLGEGIQIDMYIQPFNESGPIYKPATGGSTVLAEIDGKQLQTTRNFKQEKKNLKQALENCPELYQSRDAKWLLDDAEMALTALLQLQELGDYALLEWPKGKAIKISKETGLSQAQFSVRKEKDWFSISGNVQVDNDQVLELRSLMSLLSTSPGRFLKLEDGQIIALTQSLRQRLDDLSGLGDASGKNLRFHPLAAQALNEMTEGMSIKAGKHWETHLLKLSKTADLVPLVPSTLQGELRDYQLQGFRWMARLAHLGAGACLADDMGIGKTIQALALILSRTTDGPTLILAPTSVCNNWHEEAQRFAPTLNVHYFGSSNRQQLIEEASAFDLVICSYGLLQTEAEKLTGKQWHTIVADEAQAIKNPQTQRSKAAMALQGDFKIVTTGTPIENHLGELWNLFNFINPGLLGSLTKFNERYAQKIENQQDHATQQRLKKLLQPFILRRLKNDVLTELPARTEVTLHVDLSEEERALYEALRQNAMQSMSDSEQPTPPGQQHLKVLAEIMKLRRACCNPRLVLAETEISSSKLQAFEELVDELISNNHKALVFSQFVDHLKIIKQLLDKKGIHYQYLDGSTSMKKRKTAVNAFQSGEGDLFLISLKAGGAGLNLTAADYVVHMDPWWNPAVEDQASDRAHRMGQKRPVTIYRLVAKDTIEDKIVDLHRHKRDLANSLLEGGEVSGKMSVEDMLELIRDID